MNYDMKKSGERIRQLRIKNGYTQETLAEKLDIDRSLLSHVEAGKRGCSVDLFIRISDFFNVSLDLLIMGRNQILLSEANDRNLLKTNIAELIDCLEAFKKKL